MKNNAEPNIRQFQILMLLQVGRTTLHRWRKNNKFPEPVDHRFNVPLWDTMTVMAWIKENQHWLPKVNWKGLEARCIQLGYDMDALKNESHQADSAAAQNAKGLGSRRQAPGGTGTQDTKFDIDFSLYFEDLSEEDIEDEVRSPHHV